MKYLYVLLSVVLLCALFSCKTNQITKKEFLIPPQNRVVLRDEAYFKARYELWVPTEHDVQQALQDIHRFLEISEVNKAFSSHFRSEVKKIIMNMSLYRVQLVGIIFNNRRYIHCNFIHRDSPVTDWKHRLIMTAGGGFWYWYVYYDAETKEVVRIYINGCT
jgi:hypothetical protein